jgi:hypothetical protein
MREIVEQALFCLIVLCIQLALTGCAVVRIVKDNGEINTEVRFFPAVAAVPIGENPRAVFVSGVGLGVGPESSTLGAFDFKYMRLDPSCRIVVMVENSVQLTQVEDFAHRRDICVTQP